MKNILENIDKIVFKTNILKEEIEVVYKKDKKNYYVDKNYFLKIPHIEKDGRICLYGNINIEINESSLIDHEVVIDKYIPFLFSIDRINKLIELVTELKYYIDECSELEIQESAIKKINKRKEINTTEGFIEFLEEITQKNYNGKFGIYINDILQCKIWKNGKLIRLDFNIYEKSCERVLKKDDYKFEGKKILFVGMGSVNSYILKNILLEKPKYIEIFDPKKFKMTNMFRHAFYSESKYKVEAVKEFMKPILDIKLVTHKREFLIEECEIEEYDYIFISVDNVISWFKIMEQIKEMNGGNFILTGISAFGRYGKFVEVKIKEEIELKFFQFLKFAPEMERKRVVTGGCGTSTAIYNELELLMLSKEVLNNKNNEVNKIEFDF